MTNAKSFIISTLYHLDRRCLVIAHVQRWGNSLAIRIPRACTTDLGVGEGCEVALVLDGRALIVTPSAVPPLEALLRSITDTNRHEAIDLGAPAVHEAW